MTGRNFIWGFCLLSGCVENDLRLSFCKLTPPAPFKHSLCFLTLLHLFHPASLHDLHFKFFVVAQERLEKHFT